MQVWCMLSCSICANDFKQTTSRSMYGRRVLTSLARIEWENDHTAISLERIIFKLTIRAIKYPQDSFINITLISGDTWNSR